MLRRAQPRNPRMAHYDHLRRTQRQDETDEFAASPVERSPRWASPGRNGRGNGSDPESPCSVRFRAGRSWRDKRVDVPNLVVERCGCGRYRKYFGNEFCARRFQRPRFDEQVEGDLPMELRRSFIAGSIAVIILAASPLAVAQTIKKDAARKSGYAPVNGLKLYYEVHGTGEPLILLHGGVGATEMFDEIMPLLSQSRQVIAVGLQAHGRTADTNRPLSYEAMADDVAALIQYLKFDKADVMGYSVGGEVALRTAIQHPDVVRKLVLVSTTFSRDGWYPEIVSGMTQMNPQTAEQMKQTPIYQSYAQIAPRPQDWPVLCSKLGNMFRQDYDWSADVAKIKLPILLAF